jgi:CubicO group peptidase (beta-lactamase class C family)
MKAVQDGVLALDDDLTATLPFLLRVPSHPNAAITLRMLLSHTSGLRDNLPILRRHYVSGDSPIALATFLCKVLKLPSFWGFFAPGESYSYCNVGIALAALVLEIRSGIAFSAWCDAMIFGPLGLNETSWHLKDFESNEVAQPCSWSKMGGPIIREHYGYPDYPDGQLRSSIEDIAKVVAWVLRGDRTREGEVLSQAAWRAVLQPWYSEIAPRQGLAWQSRNRGIGQVWGHLGLDTGVSSCLEVDMVHKKGIVILANSEGGLREGDGGASLVGELRNALWKEAENAR